MLRFRMAALALAAVSGAMLAGWSGGAAAQSKLDANGQPVWDDSHNQRPTADSDRALPAGVVTLRTATSAPGILSVYARNGLPFDIVLTRVDATQCMNVVPEDCGLLGTDIRVASGAEVVVRSLRQADMTRTYGITPVYNWRPAVTAK
ncbi:hypothetical protein [Azospirillum picis]|uniref:Uncharacterized protein n=1 Tax=Azospirillum picis TaxID=488438 RepID=A0ABU0MLF2_9PROT|nr:hypothetical protein [Azospirillum picis]MBP2300084.1 hypothetical protein [Azospirillum picis]MDQ0534074.1 hypothetical protein [Azospirillum picis]